MSNDNGTPTSANSDQATPISEMDQRLITEIRTAFLSRNRESFLASDHEIMMAMTTQTFKNLLDQDKYFDAMQDNIKGIRREEAKILPISAEEDPYPLSHVAKDTIPSWFMAFTFMFMNACEGAIMEITSTQLEATVDMMKAYGHSDNDINIFLDMVSRLCTTNETGDIVPRD